MAEPRTESGAPTQLRQIAPGLHVVDAPQRFGGLEVGTRMTVIDMGGDLLLHSPVPLPQAALAGLGTPRWVMAPNLLHHLYAGPWMHAGLEGWGAPGLQKKRADLRFEGELESGPSPFGDECQLMALKCFPFANEVVLLHRPSKTLVVSDLVFNISANAPWATRAVMRMMGGYPGCCSTVLERVNMRRAVARRELGQILEWDFERIVMAHGEVVSTGGREALARAYRWLGL